MNSLQGWQGVLRGAARGARQLWGLQKGLGEAGAAQKQQEAHSGPMRRRRQGPRTPVFRVSGARPSPPTPAQGQPRSQLLKPVAASRGAGWRDSQAGTASVAFPDTRGARSRVCVGGDAVQGHWWHLPRGSQALARLSSSKFLPKHKRVFLQKKKKERKILP